MEKVKWRLNGVFNADANKCYAEMCSLNEITPKTAIKESGTAHRMGDNLEGGKNIGV